MNKLQIGANLKFKNYKGFVINVSALDNSFAEFIGIAVSEERNVKFGAIGKTRNDVGRELESYVDAYRGSEKQKLILS